MNKKEEIQKLKKLLESLEDGTIDASHPAMEAKYSTKEKRDLYASMRISRALDQRLDKILDVLLAKVKVSAKASILKDFDKVIQAVLSETHD